MQGFLVEKGSPGFTADKMEGKWSLRMTQNGAITLKDCFVPDKNKLAFARDFSSTNSVLETSRLAVAWCACGVATGAYENALKYTLKR